MLDSEADFKARAKEIGLIQPEIDSLDRLNYNTFGKLAFASNFVQGCH